MGGKSSRGVTSTHFPRFFDPFGGKLEGVSPIGVIDLIEHIHGASSIGCGGAKEIELMGGFKGQIVEDHPHFFIGVTIAEDPLQAFFGSGDQLRRIVGRFGNGGGGAIGVSVLNERRGRQIDGEEAGTEPLLAQFFCCPRCVTGDGLFELK